MCREGRQVTGGELHLGELGEGMDNKLPGAFMWREGRKVTGEKCSKHLFSDS